MRADRAFVWTRASAAWAALALALVAASLAAVALDPATLARLDWRRAVAENEPWRAWTAAVVHANGSHLAANAAGALLVGAYGVVARVPWRSTIAWLLTWPATQALLVVLAPSLARYVGLSGVLHAGIAVAALHVALTAGAGLGRRRAIGAATFAIVVAKVLLETPWEPTLRPSDALGIDVAPAAHAAGLLAGTVAALVAEGLAGVRARRPGPRPSIPG